ncbi:MAG TPA: type II secretion system protein [Candidatus Saccharibacteria bacterium]|nr:type II secretion system protein [Candidatus Saccharibacteria bacterium]
MRHRTGFTVIELLFVVVIFAAASIIFFVQKNNIEVTARDTQRKTAINAMYLSLEEVYFKKHGSYPRELSKDTLPSVDEALFTDPNGIKLGQTTVTVNDTKYPVASNYRYEATNCTEDVCKSYTLRTTLENEDDFVKKNR